MKELTIVRALLTLFHQNDISYCHWKSNQHFDKALIGIDDLDILIDRYQYQEVMKILAKIEFKHFYTPTARTYIGVEDFLGFDRETGTMIHLHLHSRLSVGEKHLKGFHLPIEQKILKDRVWNEQYQVYFSSPYDELLLLILRLGMKNRMRDILKKRTEKNTYFEYEWLKQQCPEFCMKLQEEEWLSDSLKCCIEKCVTEGLRWSTLKRIQRILYQEYSAYSLAGSLGNSVLRHVKELQRVYLEVCKRYLKTESLFLRRRSAAGGVTIAFLGSDGSGKSSSLVEMKKWLGKMMDVRCFYLGSGDGNSSILRLPLKIVKKLAQRMGLIKKTHNYKDTAIDAGCEHRKIGRLQKLWIYTLAVERIKKLTRMNRCRMKGYVVLSDRFPQDQFEGLCDGPRLKGQKGKAAAKEAKAFRCAKLCAPDLVIKFLVSPEVAMQRKPGEIEEETSRKLTERIQRITFNDATRVVEINADQSQEEVWLEVKRAIWSVL